MYDSTSSKIWQLTSLSNSLQPNSSRLVVISTQQISISRAMKATR